MKSILITGCSSGIGYDAAMTLHERGWKVFATCRKQSDCDRLESAGLRSTRLDHDDADSIASALEVCLKETGGTLDAVFLNGAYAIPGAMEDLSRDALRAIFETNVFGPFDIARRVVPIMAAQGHGRIVNCSSVLGYIGVRFRGAYVGTKHAMEGMTDSLRMELKGTGIETILIDPGPIDTPFRDNARIQFERWINWQDARLRGAYERKVMPRLYAENPKPDRFELPASAVTQKLIHALESPRPRPRYLVTTPAYAARLFKRFLSTRMVDRLLRNA